MIIITGGLGFIGSRLVQKLNEMGRNDLYIIDNFGTADKWQNINGSQVQDVIPIQAAFSWLKNRKNIAKCVFHMGACADTTETDGDFLWENNVYFSKELFKYCRDNRVPFLYASSAATYGLGELGFDDDHEKIAKLRPVNLYGFSKQAFDQWVLSKNEDSFFWAGFKFFNVYGPNEQHKGGQASVAWHAYNQITQRKHLKLFKSHHPQYADGEQQRDFVYIDDVCKVMLHFFENPDPAKSAIYNVGTGKARTFLDLGRACFQALDIPENIDWIDMPSNVRKHYQYFTEAQIEKLRTLGGYEADFTPLEAGVRAYYTAL